MTSPATSASTELSPAHSAARIPTMMGPPGLDEWELLDRQAQMLAKSSLVPKRYQGHPEDLIVVALSARELRIPMMQAIAKINVIEGTASMSAELMVALIRRDGHVLRPEGDITVLAARGYAHRSDEAESQYTTYEFTIDDAFAAGLMDVWWERWVRPSPDAKSRKEVWTLPRDLTRLLTPDGEVPVPERAPDWVKASGSGGAKRKDNWWTFTKSMLWARVASQLARMVFPDVLMGVTLTPEELGAEVDPLTGEVSDRDKAAPPELIADFMQRISVLKQKAPAHQMEALKAWFVEWKVPPVTRLPLRFVAAVDQRIAEVEDWLTVDVEGTVREANTDADLPPSERKNPPEDPGDGGGVVDVESSVTSTPEPDGGGAEASSAGNSDQAPANGVASLTPANSVAASPTPADQVESPGSGQPDAAVADGSGEAPPVDPAGPGATTTDPAAPASGEAPHSSPDATPPGVMVSTGPVGHTEDVGLPDDSAVVKGKEAKPPPAPGQAAGNPSGGAPVKTQAEIKAEVQAMTVEAVRTRLIEVNLPYEGAPAAIRTRLVNWIMEQPF